MRITGRAAAQRRTCYSLILALAVLLAACQSGAPPAAGPNLPPTAAPWQYQDVRLIDPADAGRPAHDLAAVYLRRLPGGSGGFSSTRHQVRLDFMALEATPAFDLRLRFDLPPYSSTEVDLELNLPAGGRQAWQAFRRPLSTTSGARVSRDPELATIDITFDLPPAGALPFRWQVALLAPGAETILDQTGWIFSDGPPPPPAPVIFAFWNVYPAYTPALALRRWDGAHSGPLGGRHGLGNLLRVTAARQTPVFLLDAQTPLALAALDYTGELPGLISAAAAQQVVLPAAAPGYAALCAAQAALPSATADRLWAESRRSAAAFGFGPNPFVFAPWNPPETGHTPALVFNLAPAAASGVAPPAVQVKRTGGGRRLVLPLLQPAPVQLTADGLEPAIWAALAATALSPQADILPLGGDLPQTAWGAPAPARKALSQLRSRPWVHVLDGPALLAFPLASIPTSAPPEAVSCGPLAAPGAIAALEDLPPAEHSPPARAAEQALQSLFSPLSPAPPELPALRAIYTAQAGPLAQAAAWAAAPYSAADCSADLDFDGQTDCVLASPHGWVLVAPQTGALQALFLRAGGQTHQAVGPSWQFATGLGPATDWRLDAGLEADPLAQAGGLGRSAAPERPQIETRLSPTPALTLVFTSGERRLYELDAAGLHVEIAGAVQAPAPLLLAFDPWERFRPGGLRAYRGEMLPGAWLWGLPGAAVSVSSNTALQAEAFSDALPLLGAPENPNREVPHGFFLPFPLAQVTLTPAPQIQIDLQIQAPGW